MTAWLLPENVEDVLPPQAWRMEDMRRALLDLFRRQGYQLVIPPLIEYVDSLLTGVGADLDLKTFKLVDQMSGRLMGVRADITPQVARIDAHLLAANAVNRLCYAGSILHAQSDGFHRSREPIQIGAEFYGEPGAAADLEILTLMLQGLDACGVRATQLDIGHVGVYRALAQAAGLSGAIEHQLFGALQAKDASAVAVLSAGLPTALAEAFAALPQLYGDRGVLAEARARLPQLPAVSAALDTLDAIDAGLTGAEAAYDLAELRGYGYHSGVVFAAYTAGRSRAIAQGGRYDEVGRVFGRARPATGFSLDLRELAAAGA
ncbi:ATP phosphoribosyltransferase regulatory subunit [Betaproteobacteria bacterium SCN1]|jgi:ATP phosphoribosyltransferase regulatory subunit|nr:ATP phosphoribosyltransferase regulatory subunit [Betaproteobacteria bacterium SCN1]MBN8760645.1 ATP phosphoribosyltransferase regulatory subunit [Thiobacillus sp.]ODU88027.1 MAG: ATP phosphoribosyltransferase regulatory subunit [Thiobacillus sp. SCN 65-179]OJW36275.1 MAG: ATP phosphoribosyltransferase regulatory subunit [Thiobacillus sp. 65-69]